MPMSIVLWRDDCSLISLRGIEDKYERSSNCEHAIRVVYIAKPSPQAHSSSGCKHAIRVVEQHPHPKHTVPVTENMPYE